MSTIGERIRDVRKTLKKTQKEFSQALGLSENYVWQLEKNQREPSERTLNDICRIFAVNPEWLRTGEGEPFNPPSRSEELAAIFEKVEIGDDAKSRLIRAMARLPDEAFPALLEAVKGIAKDLEEE